MLSNFYQNNFFLNRFCRFISPLSDDFEEISRRLLAVFAVLLCAPVLYVFSINHFMIRDLFLAFFLLAIALGLTASLIIVRGFESVKNLAKIQLILVGILFLCLLFTSGSQQHLALWLYVYPLVVLFLLGKKDGFIYISIFFMASVAILFIPDLVFEKPSLPFAFKARFLVSFAIVAAISYGYEFVRHTFREGMLDNERELKKEKANLSSAVEVAEKASRAKSDFLANMSHELRTPLNHILGFSELIIDRHCGDLNEMQEEYLRDIHHSSKHLLSLINDILDLAKVEAGKMELELSSVEIRTLLEKSFFMVKEKAMAHSIELSTDFNGIPQFIKADERKLKQIVFNLLSNAIKFTPDKGNICLKASTRTVSSFNTEPKEVVEVSVSDDGIGIDDQAKKRIFDAFEQVGETTTRGYEGTGLGLALTKSLVELHGGEIRVESEGEGKGSTFTFNIPI